jgi:predicted transcriptional regulator of viral defense system
MGELRAKGVTGATLSRMERAGEVLRLARGIYQKVDADLVAEHSLAEATKRAPKGIICLTSALAFHGLTVQMPRSIWMAFSKSEWFPRSGHPVIRGVRFADPYLDHGIETHMIEGVPVRVFGIAKTIADCFRNKRQVGSSIAIEGLQETLRQRKATPAEIMAEAERGRAGKTILPYLEALTANG